MDYIEIEKNKDEEINLIVLHLNNREQIPIQKGMIITTDKDIDDDSMSFDMHCCNLSGKEFYDSIQGLIGLIVGTVGAKAVISLAKYFSNGDTMSDIKVSGTKY